MRVEYFKIMIFNINYSDLHSHHIFTVYLIELRISRKINHHFVVATEMAQVHLSRYLPAFCERSDFG